MLFMWYIIHFSLTSLHADASDVVICLHPGDDFHTDICRALSNLTQLYLRFNGEDITTPSRASELGIEQDQGYNKTGHVYLNATLRNVRNSGNLSCFERQIKRLAYFIEVKDRCDPSFGTGL